MEHSKGQQKMKKEIPLWLQLILNVVTSLAAVFITIGATRGDRKEIKLTTDIEKKADKTEVDKAFDKSYNYINSQDAIIIKELEDHKIESDKRDQITYELIRETRVDVKDIRSDIKDILKRLK